MKNKQLFIAILTFILILNITPVLSDVGITSNSTTALTKRDFTGNVVLNETSTATLYVSTSSTFATILLSSSSTSNSTSHSFNTPDVLASNTQYYWKINGTSELGSTYEAIATPITTDDDLLNNSATRSILNLFVFIVVSFGTIIILVRGYEKILSSDSPHKVTMIIIFTVIVSVLSMVLKEFVTAVLYM